MMWPSLIVNGKFQLPPEVMKKYGFDKVTKVRITPKSGNTFLIEPAEEFPRNAKSKELKQKSNIR